MNTVQIITATEAKTMVPEINSEIDTGIVDNAIKLTQQSVLKPSLGQEWFDEIITQRSGGTYSTANSYIVNNYIKWILAYAVWQHLVITLSLQLNSAGLRIKGSDHSQAAESVDMQYYRDYTQNWIDNTRKAMYRYINLHSSDYPLYYSNIYGDKPRNNQYNWKMGKI